MEKQSDFSLSKVGQVTVKDIHYTVIYNCYPLRILYDVCNITDVRGHTYLNTHLYIWFTRSYETCNLIRHS